MIDRVTLASSIKRKVVRNGLVYLRKSPTFPKEKKESVKSASGTTKKEYITSSVRTVPEVSKIIFAEQIIGGKE